MNKLLVFGVLFVATLLALTWVAAGEQMGDDIVNQLSMLAAVAIAGFAVFVAIKYIRQMQTDTASGELAEENWDGIGEYKNDLPFGWAITFAGLTVWGIWYMLAGYPTATYSQLGEYNEAVAAHDAKFEAKYENMSAEDTVAMGESIFIVQCAPCHGLQADGIDGKAANLTKRLDLVAVKHAVVNGSNSLGFPAPMPNRDGLFNMNTGAVISDAEISAVSAYVANGMKGTGAEVFAGTCSACHGADGKGMDFVAPSIADFTPELVGEVLKNGKKGAIGVMPKFADLTPVQVKAVGAYVTSISK